MTYTSNPWLTPPSSLFHALLMFVNLLYEDIGVVTGKSKASHDHTFNIKMRLVSCNNNSHAGQYDWGV